MNKKLRITIPLLTIASALAACTSYSSKPGKLENLVGTYKLHTYTMRHEEEIKEGDSPSDYNYDKLKEIGAVAYFSIDADGYGYYGYKDLSTSAKVDSVFTSFNYDEKKPNLIRSIKMSDGVTHKYDDQKAPGCLDEPTMGFKDQLFKKSLNYTVKSGHMIGQPERKIPYRHVEYKRISKEASLEKINELMNTSAQFDKPFEMKQMSGCAVYRCLPKDVNTTSIKRIYEYAIINLDSYSNGEIELTYSLKENPGRLTKKLPISVAEKGKSMKIEGLDKTFYSTADSGIKLSTGNFYTKSEDYNEEDIYFGEHFEIMPGVTLDKLIQQETELI